MTVKHCLHIRESKMSAVSWMRKHACESDDVKWSETLFRCPDGKVLFSSESGANYTYSLRDALTGKKEDWILCPRGFDQIRCKGHSTMINVCLLSLLYRRQKQKHKATYDTPTPHPPSHMETWRTRFRNLVYCYCFLIHTVFLKIKHILHSSGSFQ